MPDVLIRRCALFPDRSDCGPWCGVFDLDSGRCSFETIARVLTEVISDGVKVDVFKEC